MRRMSLSTETELEQLTSRAYASEFRDALPPGLREQVERDALADLLVAAARQIGAAWPFITDVPALLLRVAARLTPECTPAALAWTDLALADACLRQLPAALAAFEAAHGDALAAALVAANIDADARAEALQRLRLRLLVHEDGAPRLAGYAGRGPLRTWLRVAALREAFRAAVGGLDARERTLLRLSLRDRLGVDQIGALYRVHRSTAARWLQAVRDKLSASTRAGLASKLSLADAEVESLIRAIGSKIDLSLGSIAAASPPT
jgi:RNA polymerase sigma-70 factor, ECF subfamily